MDGFKNYRPVPRPPYWSGFRLKPNRIEFWKKGQDRLHERIAYQKTGKVWDVKQLYP